MNKQVEDLIEKYKDKRREIRNFRKSFVEKINMEVLTGEVSCDSIAAFKTWERVEFEYDEIINDLYGLLYSKEVEK